jgi:hypothetical protein
MDFRWDIYFKEILIKIESGYPNSIFTAGKIVKTNSHFHTFPDGN